MKKLKIILLAVLVFPALVFAKNLGREIPPIFVFDIHPLGFPVLRVDAEAGIHNEPLPGAIESVYVFNCPKSEKYLEQIGPYDREIQGPISPTIPVPANWTVKMWDLPGKK